MRSLVQAAREKREPRWREMDAVMERLADATEEAKTEPDLKAIALRAARARWDAVPPPSPEQVARAREMRAAGAGMKRLCRGLGLSRAVVKRILECDCG